MQVIGVFGIRAREQFLPYHFLPSFHPAAFLALGSASPSGTFLFFVPYTNTMAFYDVTTYCWDEAS
jgi:hypothetical protein